MKYSLFDQIWPRLVNLEDSSEILLWRNDKITRENSEDKNIVSTEEHKIWLERKLDSNSSILVMFERDEIKLGIVRFDIEKDFTDISINLNPCERGKSLGSKFLIASEKYIEERLKVKKLRAKILKNNIASIKVFERSGYKLESAESDVLIYIKEL